MLLLRGHFRLHWNNTRRNIFLDEQLLLMRWQGSTGVVTIARLMMMMAHTVHLWMLLLP